MNIRISIDKEARLVWIQYPNEGDLSFNEWAAMMRSIFSGPDYVPGFSFIFDRSLATAAPDRSFVEKVVTYIKENREKCGNARFAIVVTGIPSYGMARMAQGLANEIDALQVFKNIDDAKRWLKGS